MFAVKPFRRRDYIATYRGRLLTEEESERLEARNNRYLFTLNSKWTIDGTPRYNVARYINHSCRPNAEPVTRSRSIVIIAKRRIEPGEEITYDYGADYKYFFFSKGRCRCQHCLDKKARKRRRLRKARQRLLKAKSAARNAAKSAAKNGAKSALKGARPSARKSSLKTRGSLKAKNARRAGSVRRVGSQRKTRPRGKRKAA
jgi:SET domain-containing protein